MELPGECWEEKGRESSHVDAGKIGHQEFSSKPRLRGVTYKPISINVNEGMC